MDASLSTALGAAKPAREFRNEDAYYARHSAVWPGTHKRSTSGSAGFRAIATTFAVVLIYCVLVPYAPHLLFTLA